MNNSSMRFVLLSFVVLMAGTTACVTTATNKLPLIDGKQTVAVVNGEPITRAEYQQEISALHAQLSEEREKADEMAVGKKADEKKPGRIDFAGLLTRMIDARLIVQEGRRIGLNDLPEVKEEVENYSHKALRTLLMARAVKDVKPDDLVVENLYEKAIREWKFESVLFPNDADAKRMEAEVRAGGNFDKLVDKAVADSKGTIKKGSIEGGYMKGSETMPAIGDALLTMGTGSISPVISVPGGFALVKLEDTRREESPGKRDWAWQEALRLKKAEVSQQFIETVKKKLAKTDTQLLDSIDLGTSVEEFDKLLKDERVITDIGGDEGIKVSDLAGAVQRKYFHGVERAIGKKEMKTQKYDVLDGLIERKVLVKEAKLEGIEKTDEYAVLVRTYENSLVFGMFMQTVILPDIKVMESEIKAYYEGHRSDYTSPETMNLDSVVFKKRGDAEEAMRKLRSGDQLSWIKANAAGQIQFDKDDPDHLILNGNVVAISMMDGGLKTALSGADAGDFRLYESPDGYFYVISVVSVNPPETEDYLSVREPIAKQLYAKHVQAGFADWVEKLRSSADIKVYLKD